MKHLWVFAGSIVVAAAAVACSSLKDTDGGSSGGPGGDEAGSSGSSGAGGSSSSSGSGGGGEAGTGGPLSGGNGDPRYFQGPVPVDSPPLDNFIVKNGTDGATVYDKSTGVTWQDNVPATSQELSLAEDYCAGLTYDGFTGWRLPTRFEALAVMDIQTAYSASNVTTSAFSAVPGASCFWTASTAAVGTPPDHFGVTTAGVTTIFSEKCVARCVRGLPIPATPVPVVYDLSDGTVIKDVVTGLVWERSPPDDQNNSLSPDEQKARCAKQTLAGKPARLPNVKELASITDETKVNPAAIGAFGAYEGGFLTSNPSWVVGFSDARVNQATTTGFDYLARCVAGP